MSTPRPNDSQPEPYFKGVGKAMLGIVIFGALFVGAVYGCTRQDMPGDEEMKLACIEQGSFEDSLISIGEPQKIERPTVEMMQQYGASDLYLIDIEYSSAGGDQNVKCLAIPRPNTGVEAIIL